MWFRYASFAGYSTTGDCYNLEATQPPVIAMVLRLVNHRWLSRPKAVSKSHRKIFTQIYFSGNFTVEDFFFCALNHNCSLVYDDGTVCNFESIANIVVCNLNTNAALSKKTNHTFYISYSNRVNSGKRFVKKKKLWFHGKGTGNFCTTTFTTRKGKSLLLTNMTD